MLVRLLNVIFDQILGLNQIPKERREQLRRVLRDLLSEVAEAAGRGAVEGLRDLPDD
jgi:hypothetical protein